MADYECYQTNDQLQVVYCDHSEAAVSISRAVGSSTARALMRLCNAVLNDDLLAAQTELDVLLDDVDGPSFGDRIEDGGRMGTVVPCWNCVGAGVLPCEECSGTGQLHEPDDQPEEVSPDD